MRERPRTWQEEEQRALVADLTRTQATLQARSEQLQRIFASRWYRLARFSWRLRRGRLFRRGAPPRMAGEESFARPLDGGASGEDPPAAEATGLKPTAAAELAARSPLPGLEAPRREAAAGGKPERLLIAGHSLGFCAAIAQRARREGLAVREDRWQTHRAHDEEASAAALAWADLVLCEWCLGNAVWYSRNKRPGQRLVVRFHRMELDTDYPGEVELEQVDAMAFVARHVLESACARFGWDAGDPRFQVVPNGVDAAALGQAKLPVAERTLGLIGYVPRLKRLDRALDLLELLRARDDRFRLLVKGREPWEHAWMSRRAEERDFYAELAERLERAPGLRGAVEVEPFGEDVPGFLRRVGWILSVGEVEGHSVALAEAMASGAVPVVLERPGASEQCEERWVHPGVEAAAEAILAVQERGERASEGEAARRLAERWSWERIGPAWDRLLLTDGA